MSRLSILYIALFIALTTIHAQQSDLQKKWSYNTAYVMPSGKWESGIFQPLRYGINQRIELRVHVLTLPLIPGVGAKIALGKRGDILFASEHILSTPTPFLNIISRKGIGGLISPQYDFPFILSFSNSLIATKPISNTLLLSANAGFVFALRGSNPDIQSTIDMPLFYPRMSHYYKGSTVKTGAALKGVISKKWFFEESLQIFAITRNENNFYVENNGAIMWAVGKSLRIKGGYVLTYGNYPFGKLWQLWPTLDLVFGSHSYRLYPM